MKKYIIVFALFAVVSIACAVETALLKYAPDSSIAVSEINVASLMKHPAVLEVLNKPEYLNSRQKWEKKSGVRLADLKKVAFFIGADGRIFTCIAVDKNLAIEKIFKQNNVKYKLVAAGGRKFYHLTGVDTVDQAELTELAPGVLLAGSQGQLAGYFKQKTGNPGALAGLVKQIPDVPVWLAFVNRIANPAGVVEDPQQLTLTFDFAGKKLRDWDFNINLFCSTAEGAQMMAGVVPMYMMMGSAFIFGSDPELGGLISACFKPVAKDRQVGISARINADLVERAAEYLEQNSDRLAKKFGGKKVKSQKKKRKAAPVAPMEQ